MTAHAALWEALRNRRWTVHVVAVTRTAADAAAHAAILETWRGPPAPAAPRSEADQQLLDAVELADSTGDLRPLDVKYGDAIQAARDRQPHPGTGRKPGAAPPSTSTPTPPTSPSGSRPTCWPRDPPAGLLP